MENNLTITQLSTKWYHYLLAFMAGGFFINTLPHYLHGITGRPFPTPFANPPGIGLSSPLLNIVWALINFLIAFTILYFMKITARKKLTWIALFFGATFMSFY